MQEVGVLGIDLKRLPSPGDAFRGQSERFILMIAELLHVSELVERDAQLCWCFRLSGAARYQ